MKSIGTVDGRILQGLIGSLSMFIPLFTRSYTIRLTISEPQREVLAIRRLPSLKLTFSHLKMDCWKTISLWDDLFSGVMLVAGRAHYLKTHFRHICILQPESTPKLILYDFVI